MSVELLSLALDPQSTAFSAAAASLPEHYQVVAPDGPAEVRVVSRGPVEAGRSGALIVDDPAAARVASARVVVLADRLSHRGLDALLARLASDLVSTMLIDVLSTQPESTDESALVGLVAEQLELLARLGVEPPTLPPIAAPDRYLAPGLDSPISLAVSTGVGERSELRLTVVGREVRWQVDFPAADVARPVVGRRFSRAGLERTTLRHESSQRALLLALHEKLTNSTDAVEEAPSNDRTAMTMLDSATVRKAALIRTGART